jgi:small-conductance mechanosensitive channel
VREIGERLLGVAALTLLALVAALVVDALVRRAGRRIGLLSQVSARTRTPLRAFAMTVGLGDGLGVFVPDGRWVAARHVVVLAGIGAAAWLLTALLFVLEDSALPRLRVDRQDNRHARAMRTQLSILRRVTAVAVAVFAVGASLMTFQDVRLVGSSVLASAGLVAAVAAFATNTLLGNVVAGIQMAFSGSLRLDDVVVVEGEWGRIEELTLTYVIVRIWDDRRLVLPSSYFTTQPFQNWTHTTSQLTGVVMLDVDLGVDMPGLRAALRSLADGDPRWDGRVCTAQMIDAVDGLARVRAFWPAPHLRNSSKAAALPPPNRAPPRSAIHSRKSRADAIG